jgi:hypothetical protein
MRIADGGVVLKKANAPKVPLKLFAVKKKRNLKQRSGLQETVSFACSNLLEFACSY